ncbi:MBOAT family O-acyltransferase [Lichenifustis flavocetrariae]|uniref:Probable alginate O-acetylase AlgI n=1 Tax=Lichenifustis flavocetrariae TaxID=2949735 RepID=A0AA41YW68_9HYPH|nr:MBOAT family O-acyltransferase [Lichenifustis flavocetrariae]MCW6509734.1 MBOAT family protein [Lichenifustis flavocetrariae]
MVFSSVSFLFLFLPIFLLVYCFLKDKNLVYVVFSLGFYFIGEGWYTSIVLASVVVNYFVALWIDRNESEPARRLALLAGVAINLVVLVFFKYTNFLVASFGWNAPSLEWSSRLHLPLGVSFFTFHAISYLVDIYRRVARAERSFLRLSLYILMFPQLISGPILRFHTIARQLRKRVVTGRHVYFGLYLFCLGLGQKVLIADTLAGVADPLFVNGASLSTTTAWLAAVCYTLQILFDFSGYSNMAIGLGWLTGFHFPRNFNSPYISRSVTEFWRRWHMSLSKWFLDYLYIPLGGNRNGALQTYRNLIIVFLLCGLWHGAGWTFVLWGIYHGLLLVLERLGWGEVLRRLPRAFQHLYTMLAVIFGWVLFRADNVTQAFGMLQTMIVPTASDEVDAWHLLNGQEQLVLVLAILFATRIVPHMLRSASLVSPMPPWPRRTPVYMSGVGCIIAILLISASSVKILSGSYSPFIYFRF